MLRLLLAGFCLSILASSLGCRGLAGRDPGGSRAPDSAAASNGVWSRTELYFGLNTPDGDISDAEWEHFVESELTPRFPDGLTVLTAYGQWKNQTGKVQHESSRLVILLHPRTAANDHRIEDLRRVYCQRYKQESVLRVTSFVSVSFATQTNTIHSQLPPLR